MPRLRAAWKQYRVWLLVLLAGFTALFCFTASPASWFDEGMYYQIIKNAVADGVWGIQLAPGQYEGLSLISVGYSVFYPAVLAFQLFGESIAVLRLVAILFLFGFVLVFYLLAKKLYGPDAAFWSALFLVSFSPLYGNGKNFLGEVPGLFYFFLGLLILTYLASAERKKRWALLGGFALGLAASAKPLFLLILPAVGIAYLITLRARVVEREERPILALVAAGMSGALLLWALTQFSGFSAQTDVYAHYANPYYVTDFWPLLFSNLKRFVSETTPIHFLLLLAVAGWFVFQKIRRRESVCLAESALLIFVLLVAASYLRTAGWYRYFFPAHAVLFLFLAPGLRALFDRAGLLRNRWWRITLPVLFAAVVAVQLMPLKGEALRQCDVDAPTAVEPYLNGLPKDAAVFFYNLPQVAARYSGKDFFQYMKMSEELVWGKENEERMRQGAFDYIFVAHNVPEEISRIPRCFEFQQDIRQVLIYKRNASVSCDI